MYKLSNSLPVHSVARGSRFRRFGEELWTMHAVSVPRPRSCVQLWPHVDEWLHLEAPQDGVCPLCLSTLLIGGETARLRSIPLKSSSELPRQATTDIEGMAGICKGCCCCSCCCRCCCCCCCCCSQSCCCCERVGERMCVFVCGWVGAPSTGRQTGIPIWIKALC